MRYFFVFISIIVIWVAVVVTALLLQGASGFYLYLTAIFMTLMLFFIGFYSR